MGKGPGTSGNMQRLGPDFFFCLKKSNPESGFWGGSNVIFSLEIENDLDFKMKTDRTCRLSKDHNIVENIQECPCMSVRLRGTVGSTNSCVPMLSSSTVVAPLKNSRKEHQGIELLSLTCKNIVEGWK